MPDIYICPECNKFIGGDKTVEHLGDGDSRCPVCKEVVHEIDQTDVLDQLHQERERAEQYADILRTLVEAQDEINIEAEKPLHQRSTAPIIKKQRAIKEARRALESKA